MILKYVTITGIDEKIDINTLSTLSEKYPFVEWGVLISESNQGNPRYPVLDGQWIRDLVDFKKYCWANISFHLCGEASRKLFEMDMTPFTRREIVDELIDEIKRIQLNINGNKLKNNPSFNSLFPSYLIGNFNFTQFIIQKNKNNDDIWKLFLNNQLLNFSILFDASGGRGEEISEIPKPISGVFCGYAGGLGPDNIEEFLPKLEDVIGDGICWIDMETKVRTNNQLDLDKVEFVLDKCKKYTI